MDKGNVLVLGNSGVGKSTLINAVLGDCEQLAETGSGIAGTTTEAAIYTNDSLPFRLIDTMGFEPSFFKEQKAIHAIKKMSKDSAKKGREVDQINVIWFCIDGTSRKLFPKAIQNMQKATSMWKNVPVIVVITKSYSISEREDNIRMVEEAFAAHKRSSLNVKRIIPVVAATYALNETAFAPPEGITELIDATNELMPDGLQAAEQVLSSYKLMKKRAMVQGIIGLSTSSAVAVGLTPTSFADALLLQPLEVAEIASIAKIYGIKKDMSSKAFFDAIVEIGTVSAVAKTAIAALKNIPGINIGAAALNAIIAGSIVAALGEGSAYAFEQVYLGNKTLADIEWLKNMLEAKLSKNLIPQVTKLLKENGGNLNKKAIAKMVMEIFVRK